MARKRRTRASQAKRQASASEAEGAIATITVSASSEFFEAVSKLDHGLSEKATPEATGAASTGATAAPKVYSLVSWRSRDKVLTWFSKGIEADASARLSFSPDLSKQQREELHRMRSERFTKLASQSTGFGDSRCIVFAHADAYLGAEQPALSEEQLAAATELYRDLKNAGHEMSLDEVKTRYAADELTDDMASMLKHSDKDQEALRAILAAIGGGDKAELQAALRGKQHVVKSGLPVRGSGTLPLQAAVSKGSSEMAQLLLDAGAPVGTIDGQGATPMDVARKHEFGDIEGLLLRHGASAGAGDDDWAAQEDSFTAEAEAKRQQTISAKTEQSPAKQGAAKNVAFCKNASSSGARWEGAPRQNGAASMSRQHSAANLSRQASATNLSRQASAKGQTLHMGKHTRQASANLDVRQMSQDASAAAQAALDALQQPLASSSSGADRAKLPKPPTSKQAAKPAASAALGSSAGSASAVTVRSTSDASDAAAPDAAARENDAEAQSASGNKASESTTAPSTKAAGARAPHASTDNAATAYSSNFENDSSANAAAANGASKGPAGSTAADPLASAAAPSDDSNASTKAADAEPDNKVQSTVSPEAAARSDAIAAAVMAPAREMNFPVQLPAVQQPMTPPQPVETDADRLADAADGGPSHPKPQHTQQSERHADESSTHDAAQPADTVALAPSHDVPQQPRESSADAPSSASTTQGAELSAAPEGQPHTQAGNETEDKPAQPSASTPDAAPWQGKHRVTRPTAEDMPTKRLRGNAEEKSAPSATTAGSGQPSAKSAPSTAAGEASHNQNAGTQGSKSEQTAALSKGSAERDATCTTATSSSAMPATGKQSAASAKPYAAHGSVSINEIDSNGAVGDDDLLSMLRKLSQEYYDVVKGLVQQHPEAACACAAGVVLGGGILALSRKR